MWALYGHLSAQSIVGRAAGQAVKGGEVLGWLGAPHENGGMPPLVGVPLWQTPKTAWWCPSRPAVGSE